MKILGAVYRIPFARYVGDEGMGLYQMAYPFYTVILAISTAGIPLAVSRLTAERFCRGDWKGAERITSLSLKIMSVIGLFFAVLLWAGADFLAVEVIREPRAALSIRAVAPAVLLSSVAASFRGYFQGMQNMVPTAVSQIVEQIFRVVTVLVSVLVFGRMIEHTAAGASAGASVGALCSVAVISFIYFRTRDRNRAETVPEKKNDFQEDEPDPGETFRRIIRLAVPISIGALVLPLMQLVDTFLVTPQLQTAGFTPAEATALYGQLSGMAGAIINLPFIITTAVAASLVPAAADFLERGKKDEVVRLFSSAMRIVMLLVTPAAVGLMLLAGPVCLMLYDVYDAGTVLFWLAPSIIAIGVYQTSAGLLQGLNRPEIPMYSLFVGVAVKIAATVFFISGLGMGIKGAALATVTGFAVASVNNLYYAAKELEGEWFSLRGHLFAPVVSVAVMSVVVVAVYGFLLGPAGNTVASAVSITAGAVSFFLGVFAVGGISRDDFRALPGGTGERLLARPIIRRLVKK